jgi:hypothetical protein
MERGRKKPMEPRHEGETDNLFDDLIALHHTAFAQRRYNTAYHTLSAALHWAQEEKDTERLQIATDLARSDLDWIDAHSPEYQHSSRSALLRGHTSIFENLERRARMILLMIQREDRYAAVGRIKTS